MRQAVYQLSLLELNTAVRLALSDRFDMRV